MKPRSIRIHVHSMEPIVITQAILDTYYDFIDFRPAPDLLVDVICYQGEPDIIDTFHIFRGMVFDNSDNAIVLTPPVTKVSVVTGTITYSGPARPDDNIVVLFEDVHHNIYWKYHTPAMHLPIRKQKKTASEPIEKPKPAPEPITPKQVKQPMSESPVSVMSTMGGKRTKRRKKKRKSRRKN